MTDLTLIYYSANRITEHFQSAVLLQLCDAIGFRATEEMVVSVTHQPMAIGRNICIGNVIPSIWQVYQNILIGARAAMTPFVACVEDDSLYVPEHFTYRPAVDTFAYNRNRWVISRRLSADGKHREAFFYFRERTQMAQCVCARDLLIETLEERFAAFPQPIADAAAYAAGWGEPGRYEKNLHLTPRAREYFSTADPNVTFNHSESIRGRRQVQPNDIIREDLPPWGQATALWDRVHG